MAETRARRSPHRNLPPTGKDEVTGAAATEGSDTPTPTPAMARAPTPYSAIEMARTCARSSSRQNPSPIKYGNGEPAEQAQRALIDSIKSYSQSSRSSQSLKELQPISSDFCTPTVNIFRAYRLAPPLQLLFLPKSYLNSS